MQRRVLEIKKKTFGGINLTWRRIIDEAGKNQETWELNHEDFLRLVADSVKLSQLNAEKTTELED